ncbi:thiamine pyrophosphate-dependent enzyme [Streptosporangium sp. NPDC051022]|uniref:thiamine pyrophosphate-dependent enzyme n=1 Tax=Streptosporangium sp. NPDC051022 TaxID=3155752 RepID=UPI00343CA888
MLDMREALATIVRGHPDALYVSTCGYITRDLYNVADRPENFYLVGSMGMAAPIGLGIALAQPHRQVVILDGDGSFAMNLSCLPMIGVAAPRIVHVVLDNQRHESTGGQRTVRPGDPVALARACGYAAGYTVSRGEALAGLEISGMPALVHVLCRPRDYPPGRRVEETPPRLVARFRAALATSSITDQGGFQ